MTSTPTIYAAAGSTRKAYAEAILDLTKNLTPDPSHIALTAYASGDQEVPAQALLDDLFRILRIATLEANIDRLTTQQREDLQRKVGHLWHVANYAVNTALQNLPTWEAGARSQKIADLEQEVERLRSTKTTDAALAAAHELALSLLSDTQRAHVLGFENGYREASR